MKEDNEVRENIMEYILGGKSEFTLVQEMEGRSPVQSRYRVTVNDTGNLYFICIWDGKKYQYQGYFGLRDRVIKKAKNLLDAEVDVVSLKALAWVFSHADRLPECVHIYHNGKCSRCGRKLTDAESLRTGLGPTCRQKRMIG